MGRCLRQEDYVGEGWVALCALQHRDGILYKPRLLLLDNHTRESTATSHERGKSALPTRGGGVGGLRVRRRLYSASSRQRVPHGGDLASTCVM